MRPVTKRIGTAALLGALALAGCASIPEPPLPVNAQAGRRDDAWNEYSKPPLAGIDTALLAYVRSITEYAREGEGDAQTVWARVECRVVRVCRGSWEDEDLAFAIPIRTDRALYGGARGWDIPSPLYTGGILIIGLVRRNFWALPEIILLERYRTWLGRRRTYSHAGIPADVDLRQIPVPKEVLDEARAYREKTEWTSFGEIAEEKQAYVVELTGATQYVQVITVDKRTREVRPVSFEVPSTAPRGPGR